MVAKKLCSPKCVKSPKRFSLSLTGSFISAKNISIPAACSVSSSSRDGVGGGDVDAGDRLGRDDEPADGGGRARDRVEHAVVEELGVGEKERGIPAEQHEARDQMGVRIAGDVVVALHVVDRPSTAECGRQPSQRNSITAITIASTMPGMAPKTATPAKQVIESQNSHRWMR